MTKGRREGVEPLSCDAGKAEEEGFALAEFLVSTLILLGLSAGLFMMLTDVQGTSGYQTEVLSVMENTRVAMGVLQRYIVQTGNNPLSAAYAPVTISDATEVQLCSDLTGSAGGDQGDPDGDIQDANEQITIRHNPSDRSIEAVDADGTVRIVARFISGLSFEYLDETGNATTVGPDVRAIRVTITGSSAVANPRTGKIFGLTLNGVSTLPNRG